MELDSQAKQQQTECNANKETSVSSTELGAPLAEAMPTLEATNGGDVGSVVVGVDDEGSLNAMVTEQSDVATRQTARSGGGTPKGNSLDQSEDESQAEELVVKEECTFPQDEYMEDEELQLVDQHNADSHEGTAEPKDAPQKVEEQQNSGPNDVPKPEKVAEEKMGEKEDPAKHIQTPEEMKRLILSQGQLKRLQSLDFDQFHEAVVGFYVRVNYQGLPSKFSTTIFIDQIVDVLEAESFQHLWLKRRLRLRRLGDYSLDKVLPSQNVKNDQDIVSWFSFIEAKEEIAPTIGFVHQKENDLAQASKILDQTESVRKEEKVAIKKDNLMQIALSPTMLRLLAKLDFERFRDTVVGCFVFMPCISKDKPTECQYHVIEVKNVIHGPREYKIYKKGELQAKINFQLVFPLYGKYALNWIHTFHKINEEGFKLWLSDMRHWKETVPTLEHIRDKAAQLQMALSDAERVPDLEEQERARQREEERAKRAKLPAQNAKDLDACTLSRPQLLKLAALVDRDQFAKAITGCYIRLNAGAANHFEIDQIVKVEPAVPATTTTTTTPTATTDEASKKIDKAVLELKVTGTISLTALTYIASNFKFTEDEFRKSWLAETTEANPLPTMEMVQQKQKELEEAFRVVASTSSTPQKSSLTTAGVEFNNNNRNNLSGPKDTPSTESAVTTSSSSMTTADEKKATTRKGNDAGGGGGGVTAAAAANEGGGTAGPSGGGGPKGPVATNAEGNKTGIFSVQVRDGQLTMVDMRKLLISMSKLLELMTMDKDSLIRVLRGFYARVAAKRTDKSQAMQFYIDQISGVSWGGEPYKFRNKVMTDIRLHFRHMGERTLYQLHRNEGVHLTNESFQMFIDDMKHWKHQPPTLAFIEKKMREFAQAQRRARSLSTAAFGSSPPSLAPSRRSFGELRNQPTPIVALTGFEQIHNVIQRQVASSVLTTPGIGGRPPIASILGGGGTGGGVAPFQSPPQYQTMPWQQQQQQQQPASLGNANFMGGSRGSASLMSVPSPYVQQQQQQQHQQPVGKESWRIQRQMYGGFQHGDRDAGSSGGGGYDIRRGSSYEDQMGGGGGNGSYGGGRSGGGGGGNHGHGHQQGMMMQQQQQQQQPPPLGSSLAAAGHYNTSGYGGGPTPPKRNRYASPQPPPVERFF
uniref:Plus3 domain-containing protein n=1 Tax=Globodera rostochiensis TaxID=31243 RepID=A0A914HA26_GLORO